jgi:hypothetical protein
MRHEPVAGGEIDALRPFGLAHAGSDRRIGRLTALMRFARPSFCYNLPEGVFAAGEPAFAENGRFPVDAVRRPPRTWPLRGGLMNLTAHLHFVTTATGSPAGPRPGTGMCHILRSHWCVRVRVPALTDPRFGRANRAHKPRTLRGRSTRFASAPTAS